MSEMMRAQTPRTSSEKPQPKEKKKTKEIKPLESSTSTHNHGSASYGSFKPAVSASSQQFKRVQSHGAFEPGSHAHKVKDGDDDEVFGDEKRKVQTGPNPLHNR
ncbi:hypothetical protein CRYUN_Cryun25bG0061100 [Craigia yunnanensis]